MQSSNLFPKKAPFQAPIKESFCGGVTPFFDWSDTLTIGDPVIDDQHKDLINKLNEIHTGIQAGWGKEAMDKALLGLIDATFFHFSTEESIMDMYSYPEKKTHEQNHGRLIQMLEQSINQYSDNAVNSDQDFLIFLQRWLFDHIRKDDKSFGEYLAQRGIS